MGLRYAANVLVTSGIVMSGTNYLVLHQRVEYLSMQDFNWGTSFGSPATISFWYKTNAPAGSIVPVNFRAVYNSTSYCYAYNTTAGQPNSWQYVTATVPPPPNTAPNSFGASTSDRLDVIIGPGVFNTGVYQGAWTQTSSYGSVGQTNIFTNAGNYLTFTGVQLERGTVATPFEFRPFATELALCQRYFQKSYNIASVPGTNVSGTGAIVVAAVTTTETPGSRFTVPMRANPVMVMYNPYSTTTTGVIGVLSTGADTAAASALTIGEMGFRLVSSTGLTTGLGYQYHYTANAEL